MKKLIVLIVITLQGCVSAYPGSVVISMRKLPQSTTCEYGFNKFTIASIYGPCSMLNIGDTLKICK